MNTYRMVCRLVGTVVAVLFVIGSASYGSASAAAKRAMTTEQPTVTSKSAKRTYRRPSRIIKPRTKRHGGARWRY